MFLKKKKVDSHAKKFDKLITGLIIGGAVASMIGLSKTEKGKEITDKSKEIGNNIKEESSGIAKKGYKIFGKIIVGGLKIFNKK